MNPTRFEEIEIGLSHQFGTMNADKENNPLVRAAIPLFAVASQMKYYYSLLSSLEILKSLKEQLEKFEETAEKNGVRYETVKVAHYCLCTLLDEFVVKNDWGKQEWMSNSLLVTFHNETWGGEQFFLLLDKIKVEPEKNLHLIELMYYCLVIGYMGKYQVLNNGQVIVHNLKKELEKLLNKYKGQQLSLLTDKSTSNQITNSKQKSVPIWVILGLSAMGLLGLHQVLNSRLTSAAIQITTNIKTLAPAQNITLQPTSNTIQRLTPLLKNEIESGLIEVLEMPNASKITILGDELFASGSDRIEDRYFPVLASVSQALNIVKGQVFVSGYTDDRPISSPTYPSNWHLSQGRADAVKVILLKYIKDETRVRSEGKGDKEPILPNDSDNNRAKNRRVEIIVHLDSDSPTLPPTTGTQTNSIQ